MPRATYRHTELDEEILSLLKSQGLAPTVIFDVGASNGSWSNAVCHLCPDAQYHLFEPLVDHVEDYGRGMLDTLQQHPNFRLHKYALGARSGPATMNVWPDIVGSTALEVGSPMTGVVQTPVRMLTVDDAVASLGLPRPELIKMDTQGCELEILKGSRATLPSVAVLLLECWLYRAYGRNTPLVTDVAAWLEGVGFRLWDIGGEYRNDQGVLTALDCVFINTRSGLTPDWYYA
jgi:FkbM family methyltransferase